MTTAPVLHTDRLILSGHRPGDLDELVAMWADPVVCRFIGGKPREREEVWTRLLRHIGQWSAFGHGMWVVRDRATGALVGEVGLLDTRRAIEPIPTDEPEGAWVLCPAAHGRGLGTEAVSRALHWADEQGIARTTCIIAPDNTASMALAERVGYRSRSRGHYRGEPTLILEREVVS